MHLAFDAALSKFHQNCKEMIVSGDFCGTASTSVTVNNISFCVVFIFMLCPGLQCRQNRSFNKSYSKQIFFPRCGIKHKHTEGSSLEQELKQDWLSHKANFTSTSDCRFK